MALQDVAVTAASWLDSHNVNVEVKGDKNVTWRAELLEKKWHGISVLFVYREETMWVLIDLQNLVAIIMEHRMVTLEGDLQWQQACKVVWDALGLSWYSCTCVPLSVKAKHMAHLMGAAHQGLKETAEPRIWLREFDVHIQTLN